VTYVTGTAGEIGETIQPTQRRAADGHRQWRGLQFVDIPLQFSDPRLSGMLTISSNGAGQDFNDGFANLEPRTYRIVNDRGAWAGSGERIVAVRAGEARPLINQESMVLFGEGAYVGLVAYVLIELADPQPELEAVILDIDMAPLPEPIPADERPDVTAPRGPAPDSAAPEAIPGSTWSARRAGLLDRAAHEAAYELAVEDQVEHQHRDDGDGQRCQDGVPVRDVLAQELLRPEGQRGHAW
jgi:hypothetical protein